MEHRQRDILLVSLGLHGCLNPLLELAAELGGRGHRVRLASDESMRPQVAALADAGVEFVPAGSRARALGEFEDGVRAACAARGMTMAQLRWGVRWLRGEAERMVEALHSVLIGDPPQLIVADVSTLAGKTLAQDLDVPLLLNHPGIPPAPGEVLLGAEGILLSSLAAVVALGGWLARRAASDATGRRREWQARLRVWWEIDFERTPLMCNTMLGAAHREDLPPGLYLTGSMGAARPGQTISESNSPGLKHWLDAAAEVDARVVYVSFGSLMIPSEELLDEVARGLANLVGSDGDRIRVLWSLAREYRSAVRPQLAGVDGDVFRLEAWVPQVAVLRHEAVAAVLYHGGANGVHEALSCDLPMLIIPFMFDQVGHARMVAREGAGLWMARHKVSAAAIADNLRTLLFKPEFRCSAEHLARVDRGLGGASTAADLVEERCAARAEGCSTGR